MITDDTKKLLLKAIGKKHISKISTYAKDQGLTKEDGEYYSDSMFSAVFNGRCENAEIEESILSCAEYFLSQRNHKQTRIDEIARRLKDSK